MAHFSTGARRGGSIFNRRYGVHFQPALTAPTGRGERRASAKPSFAWSCFHAVSNLELNHSERAL